MSINKTYNPNNQLLYRIRDHVAFGLSKDIGDREEHPRNVAEKVGDAILWTVDLIPRSMKAIGKSFQDPRVVTIALTALGLFATSLIFYPATTLIASKLVITAASNLLCQVPFWAVKFSTYLTICSSIIGAGLRAGGRFNNASLMNDFYRIPANHSQHPARLYAYEIATARKN